LSHIGMLQFHKYYSTKGGNGQGKIAGDSDAWGSGPAAGLHGQTRTNTDKHGRAPPRANTDGAPPPAFRLTAPSAST